MTQLINTLTAMMLCCCFWSGGALAMAAEVELLWYVRDPWLTVIGSDSPLVASYTDGLMIFLDQDASDESAPVYKSVRLNPEELAELRSRLKELDGLDEYYELSQATDQVTTQIVFRHGEELKQITSYGGVPPALKPFIDFFNSLQRLTDAQAVSWKPDFIEVMLWPYDHARGEPIPWPREFPGLNSTAAVKRGKSSYSIYVSAYEAEKIQNFIAENSSRTAVLIDGKKWAIDIRIPFPHEIPSAVNFK